MRLSPLLVLALAAAPAAAQPAAGQVWWDSVNHDAQEVRAVGTCRALHAELSAEYARVRTEVAASYGAGDIRELPPSDRPHAVAMASRLAPVVVTEPDELPAGRCVAVAFYVEAPEHGVRVYSVRLLGVEDFERRFRRLDN